MAAIKTTTMLMRDAMCRHGISWDDLREAVQEIACAEIDRDLFEFRNGGAISINIAAGIIALIVKRKSNG